MKLKWILALVVVVAVISAAMSLRSEKKYTTSSDQAYNYFMDGMEAAERLYNTEALENFEIAVQLDSSFASAWAYLSKYYKAMGRSEEAKLAAKRAFKLAQDLPERERLNVELLTAEFRGDQEQFETLLEVMLERYPGEIEPHIYRADNLWRSGKFEEAIEEFKLILKINPNHALTYNSLGYLHAQIGDFDKAIEYLKKYVFIAPDQANPHDSLGEIYIMVGRYQDAIDHFRRAFAVKPNLATEPNNLGCFIYLHMAQALRFEGRLKETRASLIKAQELSIGEWYDQLILVEEARIHSIQKHYDEAIATLNEARQIYGPHDINIRPTLAGIYCEMNRPEKVRELIAENRADLHQAIYKIAGDSIAITEEVIAEYSDKDQKCERIRSVDLFLKVYENRLAGDYKTAHEYVQAILNSDAPYIRRLQAHYLDAKTYFDEENYKMTIENLQPILEANPYHPSIKLLEAKAQHAASDLTSAKTTLEEFISASFDADEDWVPRQEAIDLLDEINTLAISK